MADSFSDVPDRAAVLSTGRRIAGIWTVQSPSGDDSRLGTFTPIEREGARYGYQKAGRPFGKGREGLETWLELRARANGR